MTDAEVRKQAQEALERAKDRREELARKVRMFDEMIADFDQERYRIRKEVAKEEKMIMHCEAALKETEKDDNRENGEES